MGEDLAAVKLLARREIEARMAIPLIQQFAKAFGEEKALEQVAEVIRRLAGEAGREVAGKFGGDSMPHFHGCLDIWGQGGALEIDVEEKEASKLVFKVTRCRYAEMYEELGSRETGLVLSCERDAAFAQGFNPKIRLTRTQTIMGGAPHCDFCFEMA